MSEGEVRDGRLEAMAMHQLECKYFSILAPGRVVSVNTNCCECRALRTVSNTKHVVVEGVHSGARRRCSVILPEWSLCPDASSALLSDFSSQLSP